MDLPAPTVCSVFFAHFLLKAPLTWGLLLCFQRTVRLLWVITQAPHNTTSLTPLINARRIFRPRQRTESRKMQSSNVNPKEFWNASPATARGQLYSELMWSLKSSLCENLWTSGKNHSGLYGNTIQYKRQMTALFRQKPDTNSAWQRVSLTVIKVLHFKVTRLKLDPLLRGCRPGREVKQHVKWYDLLCQIAFGMLTCETAIVVCDIRNVPKIASWCAVNESDKFPHPRPSIVVCSDWKHLGIHLPSVTNQVWEVNLGSQTETVSICLFSLASSDPHHPPWQTHISCPPPVILPSATHLLFITRN